MRFPDDAAHYLPTQLKARVLEALTRTIALVYKVGMARGRTER